MRLVRSFFKKKKSNENFHTRDTLPLIKKKKKLTSKAVHPYDHTSDVSVAGSSISSRNSGGCQRIGPTSGLESVSPVGLPRSSITLERPKSHKAPRPSSVMSTLF